MQVTIHRFAFESFRDAGYLALKAEIKTRNIHAMDATGDTKELPTDGAVFTVKEDPKGVHSNQFATVEGVRIFDCRILAEFRNGVRSTRRIGYILKADAGFEALQAFRARYTVCGYCGKRHAADTEWCTTCLGSEYLKESDLYLLRCLPLSLSFPDRKEPAPEWLVAAFKTRSRDAAAARMAAAYAQKVERLERRRANLGLELRLLESLNAAGVAWHILDNLIYYDHTGKFCFGWKTPLAAADAEELRFKIRALHLNAFNIEIKEA